MIKIIKNPSQKQVTEFEKFANKNWGEHGTDGDPALDFYDYHRIIFKNYQNNKLVSGLVVFLKSIVFSTRTLHIAGIGGVVTHTKYRHHGYALETLNYAVEELKKMNLDAVLLCTEIQKLGNLYKKAGFVPLNKPYYFIDKKGIKKSEKGGMIANTRNSTAYKFILNTSEEIFVGLSNF